MRNPKIKKLNLKIEKFFFSYFPKSRDKGFNRPKMTYY